MADHDHTLWLSKGSRQHIGDSVNRTKVHVGMMCNEIEKHGRPRPITGNTVNQRAMELVDVLESYVNCYATSTYTPHFRAAIAKHRAALEDTEDSGS